MAIKIRKALDLDNVIGLLEVNYNSPSSNLTILTLCEPHSIDKPATSIKLKNHQVLNLMNEIQTAINQVKKEIEELNNL